MFNTLTSSSEAKKSISTKKHLTENINNGNKQFDKISVPNYKNNNNSIFDDALSNLKKKPESDDNLYYVDY